MRTIRSQTKIVATLGPASSSKEKIKQLIEEGVDVFRLNFSHSTQQEHLVLINFIKTLNVELNTNISILADLQGPKLRVGEIENNCVDLKEGDVVTFVSEKCVGTKEKIYISYKEFAKDVSAGEKILVDDGKIMFEVIETNSTDSVKAKVIYGGPLSSRKGVNLPNTKISLPSLTIEDISNANFALDNDVDWIALSFVREAKDISALKEIIRKKGGHAGVIAKIEKPEALDEIDEIINLTDGVMVARGDLGIEMPFDEVPLIQKSLVKKCILASKPVIIATQMMESMITNFRPTRAEATDVANAVLDGADALMLSAETSVGEFPVDTIFSMQKIIDYTENIGKPFNRQHEPIEGTATFLADSLCLDAALLSRQVKAKAIICLTHSGYTAFRISSHRPEADIFAFTDNKKILQKMSLVWGVRAYYLQENDKIDDAIEKSISTLKEKNLVKKNDVVVFVGSTPLHWRGTTNMLKVETID
jgi:pyruvate kinase